MVREVMVKKFSHFANRVVSFSDHLFYSQYRGKEKEGGGREGLRRRPEEEEA